MGNNIEILDSTLRDGAQGQGISFSLEDKLKIVKALDELKITYIEAGNPGSNPKDMEFFKRVKTLNLLNSEIVAFGSTRRPNIEISKDTNIQNLLEANTNVVVIFGKSSAYQVKNILKTELDENINMIKDTISYLIDKGKKVIFDCEHFFDGYKENKDYALSTLKAARDAGASTVVLCDTNGGTLPEEIKKITEIAVKNVDCKVGIHCHNNIGMAVANSVISV
ncbi:MAG: citramalate synthase, partial [Clostridium baratii]|nr:citramalate synthase [Clostridium baratii]